MASIEKIAKWAEKGKAKKLISALKNKDSSIVTAAIEALGNVGGEDAVNAITALLENPVQAIRTAAFKALGKCGTQASETRLKYYLNKETDQDMIAVIKEAIQTYTDTHKE